MTRQEEIEDLKKRQAAHGDNPEVRKRLAELSEAEPSTEQKPKTQSEPKKAK